MNRYLPEGYDAADTNKASTLAFRDEWENEDEEQFRNDSLVTQTSRSLKKLGFLISDALIPTWWTQLPDEIPLLTGWLSGPKAEELKTTDNDTLLRQAIISLSYLFGTDENIIKEKLTAFHVTNWTAEPFTRGAYAYSTLFTSEARKIVSDPKPL